VIIAEEVSRALAALGTFFNMAGVTVPLTILNWGNEEQKKKYIPPIISGKIFGCFGLTEPNAGTDAAALQTTARKDGDVYILNGTKIWITNATIFGAGLCFARTDPKLKHRGISAFIVERSMPGIKTSKIENKFGHRASPTGEVLFEDCRVPKENLLGKEGEGFFYALNALDFGRVTVAARCVGIAQACIDAAVKYADQREQFGEKIGSFQMVQSQIAEMVIETEAARWLVYRAAWLEDQRKPHSLEGAMAKYFASETAVRAARNALTIFGAYGYSDEFPVGRYFRDAYLYIAAEGSNNIQKVLVAQDALGWKKANRHIPQR